MSKRASKPISISLRRWRAWENGRMPTYDSLHFISSGRILSSYSDTSWLLCTNSLIFIEFLFFLGECLALFLLGVSDLKVSFWLFCCVFGETTYSAIFTMGIEVWQRHSTIETACIMFSLGRRIFLNWSLSLLDPKSIALGESLYYREVFLFCLCRDLWGDWAGL